MGEHLEDDRHGWRVRGAGQVALGPAQELQQRGAGLVVPFGERDGSEPRLVGEWHASFQSQSSLVTDCRNKGPAVVSQLAMTSSASGNSASVT